MPDLSTPFLKFLINFLNKKRDRNISQFQAAKYAPALELVFGEDVIAALVLTGAADLYTYAPIGGTDSALPVCSGDMLFNVFDEYLHFLRE